MNVRVCAVASVMFDSYNPMDCSSAVSSVHKILQAGILEWVVMPSSKGVLLTQRLNLHLFSLLHWQEGPLLLEQPFSQANHGMLLMKCDLVSEMVKCKL